MTATAPLYGLLAEFDTTAALYHACERMRAEGYTRFDAHSPFPIHGLEDAAGIKPSRVPWIALVSGLTGASLAMTFQWWTSAVDYPLVISGKPLFSWQAFVPVTFEVGVLFTALGALVGMLALNGLPRYYHSLFRSRRFERMGDDRFFLSVEAADPRFDREGTAKLLESLGAAHIEAVEE